MTKPNGIWAAPTANRELAAGGVYTSWFQFSKTSRGDTHPTWFGPRYAADLNAAAASAYNCNSITGLELSTAMPTASSSSTSLR